MMEREEYDTEAKSSHTNGASGLIFENKSRDRGDKTLDLEEKEVSNKDKTDSPLSTLDISLVVLLACFGNTVVYVTRFFPSGFYIEFLKDKGLNKTLGTIAVSTTLITAAAAPYLFNLLPHSVKRAPLISRVLALCLTNLVSMCLMGAVDVALTSSPGGGAVFGIIFVTRGIQGLAAGILFLIVQGEIVDLYLKEYKTLIVVISSSMHIGTILASILGTQLYVAGGWLLTGPGMAAFNLLPILLLPAVGRVQKKVKIEARKHEGEENAGERVAEKVVLSRLRDIAFYMPDLAIFLNNLTFNLLVYVLPARMVAYTGRDLNAAVLFINLLNLFCLISALVLGYLADKKFSVLNIMLLGNGSFHVGCILAFGTTTTFLNFPFGFELGSVLIGIGDAAIMNLCIMSKFVVYEKWGVNRAGLGARSTAVNNLTFNVSAAVGTALSGLSLTRSSEVPTLGTTAGMACCVCVGLIIYRFVK